MKIFLSGWNLCRIRAIDMTQWPNGQGVSDHSILGNWTSILVRVQAGSTWSPWPSAFFLKWEIGDAAGCPYLVGWAHLARDLCYLILLIKRKEKVKLCPRQRRGLVEHCRPGKLPWQDVVKGAWCSGITSASHAEGPGLKSQCVHCFALGSVRIMADLCQEGLSWKSFFQSCSQVGAQSPWSWSLTKAYIKKPDVQILCYDKQ